MSVPTARHRLTIRRRTAIWVLSVLFIAITGGAYWYGAYQAQKIGRDFCDVLRVIDWPRDPMPPLHAPETQERMYMNQQKFITLAHRLECPNP